MTLEEFQAEYEDLLHVALTSGYQNYEMRVRDWLDLLDTAEPSRERVKALEAATDFPALYARARESMGSMVGSGTLEWSRDRTKRLGEMLGLFRYIAEGDEKWAEIATDFLYTENHFDSMVYKINTDLFEPFARDLLKDIVRSHNEGAVAVPASDRIVRLDHNSASYAEAVDKLSQVKDWANRSNELAAADPAEKERVIAEVEAGERLLRAVQVRAETVWKVLQPALRWLREKTTEAVYATLVAAALTAVAALLGVPIPGL